MAEEKTLESRTDWSDSGAEEGKKRGRKAKAAKVKAEKAEKPAKASRRERKQEKPQKEVRSRGLVSMVTASNPSREELARVGAMEFNEAVSTSMQMLKASVPEANSPEEAWKAIESKLGPSIKDPDAQLPDHPIYSGDTLVYSQLRRHYGRPHAGSSFRRGWEPGGGANMPPILGGG